MHARGWKSRYGWLLAGAMLAGCAGSSERGDSGSTSRTLSQAEVDALLAGEGMGMAAPAEINGYPGPAHVLELKEELALTPDQRFATSRLLGLMRGQARALGQRIVNAERRLDEDLANDNLTGAQVRGHLDTIAALRAQLRYTHIDAHLEQKKILSAEQVARYYELRGRVVLREPTLPPEPTESLALPVESPAVSPAEPVEDVSSAAPASPALMVVPAVLPTLSPEPEIATPEEAPQPVESATAEEPALPMEDAAPVGAVAPIEGEAEPITEETPANEISAPSPGAQDAMENAEPAGEPPAYPLTPVEETSPSPALLPEASPREEEPAVEETPAIEIQPISPGAQDAMEDAEPAREPPAYPLTPVEETPRPPALLLEASPREEEPAVEETAAKEIQRMSPGMQDAMEFAEPDSTTAEPVTDETVRIAPLEELQPLEPTDRREPVTIDLDN